jgi:hypothetical protein
LENWQGSRFGHGQNLRPDGDHNNHCDGQREQRECYQPNDNPSMAIRDTQLLIVTDAFAYVVEDTRTQSGFSTVHGAIIHAVSGRHHGCRFVVGDSVKFYQDKAILHVIDADGKECKTEVLRQEQLK